MDRNKVSGRLTDIDLSENAKAVLAKRYLKKNEQGEVLEAPIDMFRRVASNIAEGEYKFREGDEARALYEEWNEKFLQMMLSRKFMPNSPTLMNAGRELQQLSACFVLPVEDSIDGIYDTLKHQAVIHKSGGGTGFGFSRLRPKNDIVKSTMGVSSGPVSFMAVFDASTEHIKQGGTRRGANMGILRVDHPDIEEFITCKNDNEKINNFNISVAITDEFMESVRNDTDFDLVNPRDGKVMKTVRARDLFEKIVHGAWLNGEPGVVFIDKIDGDNPTPQFPIESTNPCSEAHLPPYDSCNLGSINLERFVRSADGSDATLADGNTSGEVRIDWDELRETVHTAVRFLDNVIEQNNYPLAEIDAMSRGNRRIGLGVMGFADALIQLGITYDSEEGLAFAEKIMKFVDDEAWAASKKLAEERGVMPNFEGSRHEKRGLRARNATVTTIAPTGTISMIAGCSGGIEPLFAVAFMRRQADMEMPDVNPEFVRLAKERGFYSEELMKKVAEHGSVRDIEEVPEDVRNVWVVSHDISPEWHVRMQAAFQKHTSMGISKTINLPNEATTKDVEDAYMMAFDTGCKGVAVYRDGSRDAQVLSTGATGKTDVSPAIETPDQQVRHVSLAEARNGRPKTLSGVTKKLTTGHGPLYVTMNDDEFGPRECFVVLGKPGGTAAAFSDALGRMISLAMTHGAKPEEVIHQLRGIQDGHPYGLGPNAILSVPDGVAKAMGEHYLVEGEASVRETRELPIIGACPDCGSGLTRQEGCVTCHSCGYSKCS
ncbi:ribonucleoside-diphosphate reductase class II [Rubrobacter radiotolerans DSM 5868]|uniref:Vitamin B12-dependent ribonucleotide reductase n=1 Tax=Rubrobacter radiotolerans TaxID=42256 RepID=A0AB35T9A0_RUBRA|nr:vitamin B12-dependent ribonucleotide reductase [Rubrobacter radiotolerans]MDX5894978.1 vitamin B12-dependent ribonucleotide reductase [Rubrobacter radiotolerans]SMC07181.1 ribonucleoside-diphosphate reductase class II [Rubrobacter radiotolerans DSM 5868]